MKKFFLLVPVAALAMTACTSESTESVGAAQQPKEISFNALAQNPTRAAVQGTTFPTTNSMEIVAYQSAPATAANYFEQTTFSYSTSVWKGSKYWPLSPATLNFYAVSAAGVSSSHISINSALTNATVAYTTGNSYSATTQSDIMYAFNRGVVTQSTNTLSFNSGNPVPLVFNHTQAQVRFQIKAADATSCAIQINNITLNGAKYNGELTLTPTAAVTATTGAVTSTVAWSNVSDPVATQAVPNITDYTLTQSYYPADDAANDACASLLIIPGTGNGYTGFTINYTLNGKSYSYTYSDTHADTTVSTVYSYKISMQLHEIEVSATVTDWTPSNTDVTL